MRLINIFLCLFFSCIVLNLKANHASGTIIITYKSAPGVTNDSMRYEVTVYCMSINSASLPMTQAIKIESSCMTRPISVFLSRGSAAGGSYNSLVGDMNYCSGPSGFSSDPSFYASIYKGFVTLPGPCSDYTFSAQRSDAFWFTDNIFEPSPVLPSTFYTTLDNTLSPNSSPDIDFKDFFHRICINTSASFYDITEIDGDSLYFTSSPIAQDILPIVDKSFEAGFSVSLPFGTGNPINVNPVTGVIQTQIQDSGMFAVTLKYEEFRKDNSGAYNKIGEGRYTFILEARGGCHLQPFNLRYPSLIFQDSLDCGSQTMRVAATRKISAASISSDLSELLITSSKYGMITPTGAQVIQDTVIEITLPQVTSGEDTIWVSLKVGSDGDGIRSLCGQELDTGATDSLVFYTPSFSPPSAAYTSSLNFLNVSFDASASIAESCLWNFGDGSPEVMGFNPLHDFPASGRYTVTMIAFNHCLEGDTTVQIIDLCDSISINNVNTYQREDSVYLAPVGYGLDSCYWDFGDGSNSSSQLDTSHIYSLPGVYTITLTVFNHCGNADTLQYNVEVCAPLIAAFDIQKSDTSVFFDASVLSSGAKDFYWDFGNGKGASGSSVIHNFNNYGDHYVTLTLVNECEDSLVIGDTIKLCPPMLPAWEYQLISRTGSNTIIQFDASGSQNGDSYYWDFGDGSSDSSTQSTHVHTYTNYGSYQVTLKLLNICGDSIQLQDSVKICPLPSASWSVNISQMAGGANVSFDASGSQNVLAYYWDFGDGTSGSGLTTSHSYTVLGNYFVTLTAVNACNDSSSFGDTITLCQPPIPSWTYQIISNNASGMAIQFDASASQNTASYQWDFGDGNSGSGVIPQHTYVTPSLTYLVKLTVTNNCNEDDSYAYRLNQIGLPEAAINKLAIYPNPVINKLNLTWQAELITIDEIILYDAIGRKVITAYFSKEREGEVQIELDVSDLKPGTYHLQLKGEDILINKQIIVQKQ